MKEYTVEEQGAHNREFVNLQVQALISKLFKNDLVILDSLKEGSGIPEETAKLGRRFLTQATMQSEISILC